MNQGSGFEMVNRSNETHRNSRASAICHLPSRNKRTVEEHEREVDAVEQAPTREEHEDDVVAQEGLGDERVHDDAEHTDGTLVRHHEVVPKRREPPRDDHREPPDSIQVHSVFARVVGLVHQHDHDREREGVQPGRERPEVAEVLPLHLAHGNLLLRLGHVLVDLPDDDGDFRVREEAGDDDVAHCRDAG